MRRSILLILSTCAGVFLGACSKETNIYQGDGQAGSSQSGGQGGSNVGGTESSGGSGSSGGPGSSGSSGQGTAGTSSGQGGAGQGGSEAAGAAGAGVPGCISGGCRPVEPLTSIGKDETAFAIDGGYLFWLERKAGFDNQRLLKRAPLSSPGDATEYATIPINGCPSTFSRGFVLAEGGSVYVATCDKIYRVSATEPSDAAPTVIASGLSNLALVGNDGATISQKHVYFMATCSQKNPSCLFRASRDGNEATTPEELSSISGDFIYPAASLGGDLLVLINNNSNGKQLGQAYYKLSSQGSPVPFGEACADGCWQPFITKSYLFWQNMPSGVFRTQRANLSKQDFVAASQGLYGLIAEEDDTAYLIGAKEGDGYPVLRIKSGGAPEKLAQLSKPLYGVKVVDGFLYLMDPIDPPTLFRVQTKD